MICIRSQMPLVGPTVGGDISHSASPMAAIAAKRDKGGGIAELLNDQPGMHASPLPELADVLPQERSTFAGPP
jgi:hypothetical protein